MTSMSILYEPMKNKFHTPIIAKLWPMKFVMYKFQNLAKIALWQHFMDTIMCYHPEYSTKSFRKNILKSW
jgi:hypothetical protein